MTSRERVAALRRLMKTQGLAAYIVPTEDPHLSEYVPECWMRREWLSGFTGSAGDVVVTAKQAGLWTDSRYYLQAERQLDPKVFRLFKVGEAGVPQPGGWLAAHLKRGQVVGADPRVISNRRAGFLAKVLAAKGVKLRLPDRNLVDRIWLDRPPMPSEPIVRHAKRFAGESVASKLARIRKAMGAEGAVAYVVTALDEIAWLFNIRSRDVEFTPLVIAYAIITRRGAALFLDSERLSPGVRRWLRGFARLRSYGEIGGDLRDLGKRGTRVLVDPDAVNRWVVARLKGAEIVFRESPILGARAVKNAVQVQGMRDCHVRDGVALVRFFHWIERAVKHKRISESEAAARLDALRAEGQYFHGLSFATIASFGPNGAVIHYRARPGQDINLRRRGILLTDSGGQYLDGTTDVSRTITLGKPTKRERVLFTRVLKGHINLSWTCFPKGTVGERLEALAKQALWFDGLDYGHGTGHGVGHFLSVHEGPVGFGRRSHAQLAAGNVVSIEPGYYEAGRYGFRTENLVVVVRDAKRSTAQREWLTFEPLTLCPIDRRLIERKLLTKEERAWLNAYHECVYRTLGRYLEPAVRSWLRKSTRPI
jgi:Xaa-Pro aminopeptidase